MSEVEEVINPKFGHMTEAYFYGNCFKQIAVDTPYPKVLFATDDGYINLIRECLEIMPEPFNVMYLLIRSMNNIEGGRYCTDKPMSLTELNAFLDKFGEFLEGCGRHHIWFISDDPDTFLVYDHHNMIFAYGQQESFLNLLRSKNYKEHEPTIPFPHYHGFNDTFGLDERDVLASREWVRYDLEPDDDP